MEMLKILKQDVIQKFQDIRGKVFQQSLQCRKKIKRTKRYCCLRVSQNMKRKN